jgi:recombinational DNA repair ATPase RecF
VSSDLVDWVEGQLEESGLDDEVGLLVLAALEGDEQLDEYLQSGSSRDRAPRTGLMPSDAEPGGTFISAITVEGFRGIGPEATLTLAPRPGLTIVAGRNGSGKSSFSEALELALTGATYRWKEKSAQWREQWRNLHHGVSAITVHAVEEDRGPIRVSVSWPAGETIVTNHVISSQRQGIGQKQMDGLGDLGWGRPLELFRPILSYDELGGMLEGRPSDLYDAIARVLGVEQLGDALKRIQIRHKARKAPRTEAIQRRKQLQGMADALDDERAVSAALLLKKASPDVAALRAVATGVADVDQGPLSGLRALAALTAPATADAAAESAGRLRQAVAELADAGAEASARGMARLELLELALRDHALHGDMTCPVCQKGWLDDEWASTARELAEGERQQFAQVGHARQTLRIALDHARGLVAARPAILDRSPLPALDNQMAAVRATWDLWSDAPTGSSGGDATALAEHLELHIGDLTTRINDLRTSAGEKLTELDDQWQPIATQIGSWCDAWEACLADQETVETLAAAEKWLKENDLRLKNERLAPIRDGARKAWEILRQESNVEIGDLALEGTATQRRVRIDSLVDGTPAQGIAVLSQGELHALALSLFLPRATMAESPFRFLVLDDPVQAMDPAKVDGLVALLSGLAKTHQVIVLSHDDRLPDAVRRSDIGATIVEVTRGKDSKVTIQTSTDPARRYLEDAYGLVAEWEDDRLSETALRRTLPGLLRFAIEAAAKDRYFSHSLIQGGVLTDLEDAWGEATTTRKRVMLGVFGEHRDNHELDSWAAAPYRKFSLKTAGSGVHQGLPSSVDPRDSVRQADRLVRDLQSGAK